MNAKQALKRLAAYGTAQNRKIYARHGVIGDLFGVSYANFGKLKREIKVDHDLALELWASGNHDARTLATMIVDTQRLTLRQLDGWVRDLDDRSLCGPLSEAAAQAPCAVSVMKKWMRSRNEWISTTGWYVLSTLAREDERVDVRELESYLKTIEQRIHSRPNRTRYAMNNALIAIGTRNPTLERKAIAAAKRIGMVEVDHGATGCKTPDAVTYIPKAAARQRERLAKRKAKRAAKQASASSKARPAGRRRTPAAS